MMITILFAVLAVSPSFQQPQDQAPNKCLDGLNTALATCLGEAKLPSGNFYWFVTNGTSPRSEVPANVESFKTQVCSAQQMMGACTLDKLNPILNSSACYGAAPEGNLVEIIRSQLTLIFVTYDSKCMHPCRTTLIPDLRECYASSGLDPTLFASNVSNGALIGTSEAEASKFCGAKAKLLPCMQAKIDACPEAPAILQSVGVDFSIFSKVINILCENTKGYLGSLSCVAGTVNDVDICQERHSQSLMQLDMQARQNNWAEDRFYASFCQLAIEQIKCDMNAWAKKSNKDCSLPDVIGFRKKLACEFLAPQCKANKALMDKQDNPCRVNTKKPVQKN